MRWAVSRAVDVRNKRLYPQMTQMGRRSDFHAGHFTDSRSIPSAHGQLRAVAEDDEDAAAEAAVHLLDALHIHDRAAMDAQEAARVEALFDVADRLAHQVRRASRVQPDVLAFRFDPV